MLKKNATIQLIVRDDSATLYIVRRGRLNATIYKTITPASAIRINRLIASDDRWKFEHDMDTGMLVTTISYHRYESSIQIPVIDNGHVVKPNINKTAVIKVHRTAVEIVSITISRGHKINMLPKIHTDVWWRTTTYKKLTPSSAKRLRRLFALDKWRYDDPYYINGISVYTATFPRILKGTYGRNTLKIEAFHNTELIPL